MTHGMRPGARNLAAMSALALCAVTTGRVADAETPLPASGELSCERTEIGDCNFHDPATGLVFAWPNDWPARRLKIVTESGPRAAAQQRGAARFIAVQYLPEDSTQPEVPLFTLAVLERSAWIAESDRAAATSSIEVATGDEDVAVVSVPSGHPFPPDSRDADIFEALQPNVEQISRTVSFPEREAFFETEPPTRLARGDVRDLR